ncbi:MAG: DoxX family protein [Xanthomonadales bacterium]|nr:DoxX family protein [Xanthomonadales bacterium]
MSHKAESPNVKRWQVIAGWFLTLSYIIGSPAYVIVEARTGLFSERFDYSPEFLYIVASVQFFCALFLFVRNLAAWSSAILTVLALGAVYSHFKIGSPLTSLPAIAYTLVQIWYGNRMYRQSQEKAE